MQPNHMTTNARWASATMATAAMLIALTSMLTAAPPKPPSTAKLDTIDKFAAPIAENNEDRQQKTEKAILQSDERSAAADQKIQAFLKHSGQDKQLEQNKPTEPETKQTPASSAELTQADNQASPDKKTTNKEEKLNTIRIECDGGIYFDNEAGILAYLKNIRLDESNSDFKLRCSDELKILFDNGPKEKKKNKATKGAEPQKTEPIPEQKDSSFSELGDLHEIIATGSVKILGKNSDGESFLASGDMASYNTKTGEMILKGGRPTLQQSANEYLQAGEDGQWIRIQMKDKDIESIITSQGKWIMQAVTQKESR
jgi:hypothetical protein